MTDPTGEIIGRIRAAIRRGDYEMSNHALDEMSDDLLEVYDIEAAILNGIITSVDTGDVRGACYKIHGSTDNRWTPVEVICRFKEADLVFVITVYVVTDKDA